MGEIITIDPITRISGFLEIKAEVEEHKIINAESQGLLYRGFETMLYGRPPMDAVYFTERICGICSAAHATAATLALENTLEVSITLNDKYIRDVIHGFEFIQNHLRQFYIFTLPSYVKISSVKIACEQQYHDYRLPTELNNMLEAHYIESFKFARLAHEGEAVLGGKAPHNHGIFVGGVTVKVDSYILMKIKSILNKLSVFVNTMMKEDAEILARYYPDYFEKGISYPNFMSFGLFDYEETDISYLGPKVMVKGEHYPLQPEEITEQIHYAWYRYNQENVEEVDLSKEEAYSFIKAPRYNGLPMEVGPLARLILCGEYNRGHSCMDRNLARVLETQKILTILQNLVERIIIMPNGGRSFIVPQSARGAGLVDTTRGALGHWINIEDKVIHNYNIITPSVWNLSPRDETGTPGVVEKALIDSMIDNVNEPIEIGRIVRSFDPCISCATHLMNQNGDRTVIEVVV